MKKIKYGVLTGVCVVIVVLLSCEDYISIPNESDITTTEIFSTYKNFQGFLDPCYEFVVDYNQHAMATSQNLGGETWCWYAWSTPHIAATGDYSKLFTSRSNYIGYNKYAGIWADGRTGIRITNLAIANLDLFTGTYEEKKLLIGQACFFRAFFHWELARSFGTIPYIDKVLDVEIEQPRHWQYKGKTDYQAVSERIEEDFKIAANNLPIEWPDNQKNLGRATKQAALGFAAKALLYAGSPLMNEASGGEAEFSAEYMHRTAETAWELIALSKQHPGQISLTSWENYERMFYSTEDGEFPYTPEILFKKWVPNSGSGVFNNYLGRLYTSFAIGCCGNYEIPTQNFVDRFEVYYNGKWQKYNENQPGELSPFDSMDDYRWENRDPRFRKAVYCVGDSLGYKDSSVFTYKFISDGYNSNPYFVKKYLPRGVNKIDKLYGHFRYGTPMLRLADIYLTYAEAVYELTGDPNGKISGADISALDAVNAIRERCGIGKVTADVSAYNGDFRALIRNERYVELCFEGQYWFDLRRWKAKPDNALFRLAFNEDFTNYRREKLTDFIFEAKHYWVPFPEDQTILLSCFEQNPGW